MTGEVDEAKLAAIRARYRGLQGDMPPFGDVITLLRLLDAAIARRDAAEKAREDTLQEVGDYILAEPDGATIARLVAEYNSAAAAVESTTKTRISIIQAVGNSYKRERDAAIAALRESLALQSHYAKLLNDYDGGARRTFATPDEWIARLRETGALADPSTPTKDTK